MEKKLRLPKGCVNKEDSSSEKREFVWIALERSPFSEEESSLFTLSLTRHKRSLIPYRTRLEVKKSFYSAYLARRQADPAHPVSSITSAKAI